MTQSAAFVMRELLLTWRPGTQRMRVLFSERRSWRRELERSFRFTPHSISFGELSDSSMARADLVVPLTMPDLFELSRRVGEGELQQPIPIPRLEVIELLDNKRAANDWMLRSGFEAMVPSMTSPHRFPYIVKKSVDQWGRNTHIVRSADDELRLAAELESADYFTQSLVEGELEYAAHMLVRDGRLLAHLTIEYEFDNTQPIKGQQPEVKRRICECSFLDTFTQILRALDFNGLCCVNYKMRGDQPMILEINPRFGGSLAPYFFSFLRRLA